MSDNDIKPVAWTSELQLYLVREQGYGTMAADDGHWSIALYDQPAIDALTQQIKELKRLCSIAEFQRKEMQAERDEAFAAADSKAGWEWKKRAEKAEAERDAAVADAARWQELCRQLDAGTFPSIVIDDAMAMGSGALELQVDAARAEGGV